MIWWKDQRRYIKRALQWESPDSRDPEIISLKNMFRAVEEDSEIGERVWKNLRPYLQPLETPGAYVSSLWTALASTGPRFALGGALAFSIMASVFLTQPKTMAPIETASLSSLSILEAPAGNTGEDPMEVIQVNDGDELLRFITYETPQR